MGIATANSQGIRCQTLYPRLAERIPVNTVSHAGPTRNEYESVTATVEVRNMLPYESVSIEIGGVDPGSGVTWSQTIPAEFTGAVGPSGGPIFGFGFPAIMYRNTAAPECPYRQHVVLQGLGQLP